MPGENNLSIDSLNIEVEVQATAANNNLDILLGTLKKINNLGNRAKGFAKITEHLKEWKKITFGKFKNDLHSIREDLEAVAKLRGLNLQAVQEAATASSPAPTVQTSTQTGLNVNTSAATEEIRETVHLTEDLDDAFAEVGANATSTINGLQDPFNRLREKIALQEEKVEQLAKKYEELKIAAGENDERTVNVGLQLNSAITQLESYKNKLIELAQESGFTSSEIADLRRELNMTESAGKRAGKGINTFLKFIKRTLPYFIMYRAYSYVMDSFAEGLANISQYSEEANGTLSQLSTTSLQLKNTLGSLATTVITPFVPLLTGLGNAVIWVANAFNIAFSAMQGKDQLTQAVKTWKDYSESVDKATRSLTGFDEINALGKNNAIGDQFETVDVSVGEVIGSFVVMLSTLTAISAVLALIAKFKGGTFLASWKSIGSTLMIVLGVMGAIQSFIDLWNNGATWENVLISIGSLGLLVGGLAMKFGSVGTKIGLAVAAVALLIAGIKDMVSNGITIENVTTIVVGLTAAVITLGTTFNSTVGVWAAVIGSIIMLIISVIKYIKEWGNMSLWQKIVAGILIVLAAAAAVWAVVEAAKMNYVVAAVAAGVSAAAAVGTVAIIDCFADGGFPDVGQMFIARESGPEMVGTIGNRTAVANNSQIVDGIAEGVLRAFSDTDFGGGGDWTINIVDSDGSVKASQIVTAAQRKNRRDGKTVIQLGT